VQFVFLLLPHIENLILGNLVTGEHEGQPMPDIINVFRRH
jgi:hypothetical protein